MLKSAAVYVGQLYAYRGYILRSAWSELRLRYAGTSIGMVWNVLNPLILMGIYTALFSSIFASSRSPGSNIAYGLYVCSGLFPWLAFADALLQGCNVFHENAIYLRKLPVPEIVFIARSTTSAVILLFLSLSVLVTFAVTYFGMVPMLSWLLLPLLAVMLGLFAFGLSIVLATINVFIKDVGQFLAAFMQIWMWAAPIVYPVRLIPERYRGFLSYNPFYSFLESIRCVFLDGKAPSPDLWLAMSSWILVALLAGTIVYGALRSEIREQL